MAITKDQTPDDLNLLQNELVYVVSSTNQAEEQFRYVFDVKLDLGAGAVSVARVRQVPNPTGYGIINIAKIIEPYFAATKISTTGTNQEIHRINSTDNNWVSLNTDTLKLVEVEFGEHYVHSGETDPTTDADLTNDQIYVIDGVQQFEDGINWTFDPYIPNDSAAKFLTNAPNIEYVDSDQYRTISWLGVATSQAGTIRVKFYEADGTVIQSEDIDISLEGGSDPTVSEYDAMQFFGCGPQNFEDGDVANLKPSNNSTLSYYSVRLRNVGNTTNESELKYFYLNESCKYTPYVLAWQNRLGAWDYYSFQKKSSRSLSIQRSTFQSLPGDYSGSSYSTQTWNRGKTNFGIKAEEEVTVNTDFVTEEEYAWLEELLTSREVYHIGSVTRPIVLTDSSYLIKTGVNDKIMQLSLKFKYSNKRKV